MKVSITKNGVYADGQERNEGIPKKRPPIWQAENSKRLGVKKGGAGGGS